MDGKYVSDEAYKKGQTYIKKLRTILLIVGAVLFVGGITMIVFGLVNKDDFMPQMGLLVPGIFMTFFSIPLFVISITLTITMHRRELMAFNASATLPVAGEVVEKTVDFADKNAEKIGGAIGKTLGPTIREIKGNATEKTVVCPKCQYKNDSTDKFCGGCGEKLEQKKHCTNCGAELTGNFCTNCGTKA